MLSYVLAEKEAAASDSHEKASLVDPLNTSQEKDGANGKRTSEDPLLNDSKKNS